MFHIVFESERGSVLGLGVVSVRRLFVGAWVAGKFACGVCRCVGDVLLVLRHTGITPLVFALFRGHKEVVKLLLDSKANLEAKDNDGACVIRSGVPNEHDAEF